MIKIKLSNIMKSLFFVFCFTILALTLRGHIGNPTAAELNEQYWTSDGPFELSPERGRFALAYSVVQDNSVIFSLDLARFTTPDLGYKNGKYVSLFAPGVSFITAAGMRLGSLYGASQLGTFAVVSLFALLNAYLIYRLVKQIGLSTTAGLLGSATFLFASPAFVYGVTLYQHHFSTALILLSLNLLYASKSWFSLFSIWLLCASSVPIDYPNALLMIPVGVVALSRIISFAKTHRFLNINFSPMLLTTIVSVIIPLTFFMWFNKTSYGDPFQLSGTVASVARIDDKGNPTLPEKDFEIIGEKYIEIEKQKKTAMGFFEPRDLINGLYTHTVARDRGILFFAPILLLALFGLTNLAKANSELATLATSISLIALLVYSLWGDPWGGWAFGSRYLIPAYAMLSIMLAAFFDRFKKNFLMLLIASLLGLYSIFVNTTGALGTIAVPPKVQVLALEEITGRVERYSWDRSWEYIKNGKTKSAIYETIFKNDISPLTYFYYIYSSLSLVYLTLLAIHYVRARRAL